MSTRTIARPQAYPVDYRPPPVAPAPAPAPAAVPAPAVARRGDGVVAAFFAAVDRYRWLIFALVAALHLAGFNGTWRMSADGALYMALGRNLAEGRGYTYLGEHHAWVEPGLPWMIAAAYKVGGRAYGPALVDAGLLAAAAVAVFFVFQLVKRVTDRPTAVVVAAMLGVSAVFYRVTLEVMTDVPFIAALFATLLAYEMIRAAPRAAGGWLVAAGGVLAMVAVRPVSMTIIAAIAATAVWAALVAAGALAIGRRDVYARQQWGRNLLLAGLAVAIFFAFRLVDPRRDAPGETVYMEKQTANVLTQHLPFYLKRMVFELGPRLVGRVWPNAVVPLRADYLDQVIGFALVVAAFVLMRVRVLWSAVAVLVLVQAAMWSDMDRYVLPPLPLIFVLFVGGLAWVARRLPPVAAIAVLAVPLAMYVGGNVYKIGQHIYEQRAAAGVYSVGGESSDDVRRMAAAITARVGPDDTVLAANNRVLAFLSERHVPMIPKTPKGLPRPELVERTERALRRGERLFVVLPLYRKTVFYIDRMGITWGPAVGLAGELTLHPAVRGTHRRHTTEPVKQLDQEVPETQ